MRYVHLYALGSAVVAALLTYLAVAPVTRLAIVLRALDHPGSRKLQPGAVPRLGGLAILLGLAAGAGSAALAQWQQWGVAIGREELLALAGGTLLVFLVGAADDLTGVSTTRKFLLELVAASLLVHAGWSFHVLRLPLLGEIQLGAFAVPVSLLWIVGVTNAINLIDGLDGLASGVVAIIAVSLLGYATLQASPGTVVLMAATAGACLGFLRHNWEPARIFMGDSGSLSLGFLLAAMTVHSALKAPAAVAILVPILALGVPVLDTLCVMGLRFLERPQGRLTVRFLRMFLPDRKHLHHLLAHFGGKRSLAVATMYSLVVISCAGALLVAATGRNGLGLALLFIEFCVVFAIRRAGLAMEARRIAEARLLEAR